ncbi:hypothetical protein [Flavobacterium sp.]|uniref:hypothetical protein n=1 Tax=Flavobacterium sp. TaxID=239 RepID=UPI003D6BF4BF
MKIKFRILNYIVLIVLYLLCTELFIKLDEALHVDSVLLTLGAGFFLLNTLNAFITLKLKPILNITIALFIASLSLYSAVQIGAAEFFPNADPYGILTAILSNIILSILFWEIAHQLKTRNKAIQL